MSMDYGVISKLLASDYADDLLSVIRSGGDVSKFIDDLDAKDRKNFIENDKDMLIRRQGIEATKADISECGAKLEALKKEQSLSAQIQHKIAEVTAAYPENRRKELKDCLSDYIYKGEVSPYHSQRLTTSPKGLIDKVRYGREVKRGNEKFYEFMDWCRKNNIKEEAKSAESVRYALSGDQSGLKYRSQWVREHIEQNTDRQVSLTSALKDRTESYESWVNEYDNKTAGRSKRRADILQFAEEKGPTIRDQAIKPDESKIAAVGLDEAYIEQQILCSRHPEKNLRSIRRSYEELDRPAAPMVAFRPGYEAFPDKLVETLKAQGFDAVRETDPRASDPRVFIVDGENSAICAPFLAPADALKANIAMVDAIYDCGSEAARSSPRTRETFARATDQGLRLKTGDAMSLDFKKMAEINQSELYEKKVAETAQTEMQSYETFYALLNTIQKKDPVLYSQVTDQFRASVPPFKPEEWTWNFADKATQDFYTRNKEMLHEKLAPYFFDKYINDMKKEAFAQGIDPTRVDVHSLYTKRDSSNASVFHGGKQGGLPYAIFGRDRRMCHLYAAPSGADEPLSQGALSYVFGASSHDNKTYDGENGPRKYGFLYEYEARKENQEITFLENCGGVEVSLFTGGKFKKEDLDVTPQPETAVLPHQNKLKNIYIAMRDYNEERQLCSRLFPLDVDKDGRIIDKRWREFVELHNPVDDTLKGPMVARQNNMIDEYDRLGKEQMMTRRLIAEETKTAEPKSPKIESPIQAVDTQEHKVEAQPRAFRELPPKEQADYIQHGARNGKTYDEYMGITPKPDRLVPKEQTQIRAQSQTSIVNLMYRSGRE